MQNVMVKREALLEAVQRNREEHHKTFLKAMDGMERKWRDMLEANLAAIRSGSRERRYTLSLSEPRDQTRDYDRLIRALQMDTREEIELTQQEFACYVMDDWQWKETFRATTSQYL
jgi:ABC-type oligopeptide transport system substrate-binding subunit